MPSDSRISSDDAKGNFTNKAQKQDELMVKDTIPLLIGQWIDLVSLKKKKRFSLMLSSSLIVLKLI